jgi:predicted phosphoribosyltransferase
MKRIFRNRREAGQLLAGVLGRFARLDNVVVLALPRGGVPVAFEVATRLGLPLDVFLVRKLGVPGHRELAMGAIASGGARVINEELVRTLCISEEVIDEVAVEEQAELIRRERLYRGHDAPLELDGKAVILVDDGIATGATMRATVRAIRPQKASQIVVAVPTAARSSVRELGREADGVIALVAPVEFQAVGEWYEDFGQTTDKEVIEILARSARSPRHFPVIQEPT